MSDIHALSGAYAVDALDQFERVAFERHLSHCAHCRNEVDGLRETATLLAETTVLAAPSALRDRVLAEVATTRPLPPVVAAMPRPSLRQHRSQPSRLMAGLVAAAAAVIAIGAGGIIWQQVSDDSSSQTPVELSAAQQIKQAPDAETYTKAARGGGSVTLVRSKSLNQAVLSTQGLASAPAGHTHELWLQHDNQMIPAGFLKGGGDQEVLLSGDAASAQRFGLSIEAETGATHPSPDLLTVFDLKST